jgi:alkanesulfonate monooxygenase SsuD/methylene tetrahydromethanopterin reductase-like flavin-dependent oxidoreductase (luciferase family)
MTKVSLFSPWGNFEQIVEAATCAEEHGFYGCLFGEHHGSPGNERPQLMLLCAAVGARTKTIRVGSSIVLSPLYNPIQLAESASMVDVISNGRLLLGLGLGYQPQDFRQFGVPFNQKVSRFEEGIEVLRKAWTEERFSYSGKRYQFDDVAVYPRPVQSPHPPIWLAAWSTEGAKRAGRLGDAYVTDPIQNLAATSAFAQTYRESAEASGRKPEIVLMREFVVGESRQEALDRYAEGLLMTYRYYWQNKAFNEEYEASVYSVADASELTWDMLAADRVIWGTPEDCIGQIEHWCKTLGSDHIQLTIPQRGGGTTQQQQLDTIALAGRTVVSKLA